MKDQDAFERRLYLVRKVVSNVLHGAYKGRDIGHYTVSLSSRTLVYKGMFMSYQVKAYYNDLSDERLTSAMALVHQRFSTNTFPSWKLAHPYRMVAHNGEINTLRGNVNWMAARQASVSTLLFDNDISKLWPISYEGQSDTACFDNALEFLTMGGYSLSHAAMMLIPEAWAGNPLMDAKRRAFYEYHACLMEPWDGPAAMAFTDGRQIGATLDRNGLRPARYLVTRDDRVLMSSEAGVLPVAEEDIVQKWRLQPGKMLLIDLEKGRIVSDDELKAELSGKHPYQTWLSRTQIQVSDLPLPKSKATGAKRATNVDLIDLQQAFGYTQESLKFLMAPMAHTGQEAIGSMGTDTPISALSSKAKLLHTYFKQNFAQVTNPPIDPIREELVMSLVSFIGPRPNILDLEGTSKQKRLEVHQPILTNDELERIRQIGEVKDNQYSSITIDITYDAGKGSAGMGSAVDVVCAEAEEAVRSHDYNIVILSDRNCGPGRVAIPSLLATSAVHHHLIKRGLRTSVGLVVETGEAHEVHQFATLAGYGAEAINPYLAFDTIEQMLPDLDEELTLKEAIKRYIKAIDKGLLKVMSKMGISTYQSYCGAQIFDAVGLRTSFVKKYFTGTHTQVEGVGLREIARETVERHRQAFANVPTLDGQLDVGGDYAYRIRGEAHMWRPPVVADLQHAVRGTLVTDAMGGTVPQKYRDFARAGERTVRAADDAARPLPHQVRRGNRTHADSTGGGGARLQHCPPVRNRCDELRVDQQRGAHDARHRHEPDRRQVEHGRGRGGIGPLQADAERGFHALGDQAGRIGALRRDDGVPRQFRHDPDQDGSGRQARRGRTAARTQGRSDDREGAPFDAGRRPDLAAAASRHLFDRRPGPADLRSEEHQSGCRHLG